MSEAELAIKIQFLERAHEESVKSRKYIHNMIEDLGAKMTTLARAAARFEAALTHRNISDTESKKWLGGIEGRLQTIERLVWIAVGGLIIIGGLTMLIGGNILKLLSH